MADESNASLNDVVALLRRQVEQADNSAKHAEVLAEVERLRRSRKDSQRVKVSRLLALFLVTAVLAWVIGVTNRHALQSITSSTPGDYFKKQIDIHQKFSYTTNYIALLVGGGLYFAVLDFIAFVLRRLFMPDK